MYHWLAKEAIPVRIKMKRGLQYFGIYNIFFCILGCKEITDEYERLLKLHKPPIRHAVFNGRPTQLHGFPHMVAKKCAFYYNESLNLIVINCFSR